MKSSWWVFIIVVGFLCAPSAAAAYCPQRADNLAAFAACMAPMQGTVGMQAVVAGGGGGMDQANARLVSAMQNQAVVPPQVIPIVQPAYAIQPYYGIPYTIPFTYPMFGMMGGFYGANLALSNYYRMFPPLVY